MFIGYKRLVFALGLQEPNCRKSRSAGSGTGARKACSAQPPLRFIQRHTVIEQLEPVRTSRRMGAGKLGEPVHVPAKVLRLDGKARTRLRAVRAARPSENRPKPDLVEVNINDALTASHGTWCSSIVSQYPA
jgi:hypothetical protein